MLLLLVLAIALSPAVRMLNFKIESIDRALLGTQFNLTEKIGLLELKNRYVSERTLLLRHGDSTNG